MRTYVGIYGKEDAVSTLIHKENIPDMDDRSAALTWAIIYRLQRGKSDRKTVGERQHSLICTPEKESNARKVSHGMM